MDRRSFLTNSGATLGAAALPAAAAAAQRENAPSHGGPARRRGEPFTHDFAPHFGMFRAHAGNDLVDQLQFMNDEGFRALEDNGMKGRPVEEQNRIAKAMERLDMTMGVFVAHADFGAETFTSGKKDHVERVLNDIDASLEVAKRVRAKWCTVVPGIRDYRQDEGYQLANCIDLLKRCAERCEKIGLVMVLEPLNFRNHPRLFLTKIAQGYLICRAVDSPSCKILDDLYHQQIEEGNLIPNIDRAWDEIAYFQVGDNPGRKEPTTGEIHYGNVFGHIHRKGFRGIVGMEHGNKGRGKEGERAVIDAYRSVDPA